MCIRMRCLQATARLLVTVQADFGICLGYPMMLHPMLPACLLTSVLSGLEASKQTTLIFYVLSISKLQRFAREMPPLPSLLNLHIGCDATVASLAADGPGAALLQIFAYLPSLQTLSLDVRLHASVRVRSLALPASLKRLDLSRAVLRRYMGQQRQLRLLVEGLTEVLSDMTPLKQLRDVALPLDAHSSALLVENAWAPAQPAAWAQQGVKVAFADAQTQ